jgi:hypothetical protein
MLLHHGAELLEIHMVSHTMVHWVESLPLPECICIDLSFPDSFEYEVALMAFIRFSSGNIL